LLKTADPLKWNLNCERTQEKFTRILDFYQVNTFEQF